MHVTTVPAYKELDTVAPSSSSDRAQCKSRLYVYTVAKKLKKRGGGTLDSNSMPLLKFFLQFKCVFEAIFKIKVSKVS
jgi:hypothetical protein